MNFRVVRAIARLDLFAHRLVVSAKLSILFAQQGRKLLIHLTEVELVPSALYDDLREGYARLRVSPAHFRRRLLLTR